MSSPTIRRALISVSNKQGLVEFARGLVEAHVEIYSTGGTRKHLQAEGLPVLDVAEYTGFPEMMDGRVKTLHPKIFAGILCRHDRRDDMEALEQHQIVPLELVVVNLYPFQETVSGPDVSLPEAIEQIDIGGPSLVRAAAKNQAFTTIVTRADQYATVLDEIRSAGRTSGETRAQFACDAFLHTADYDRAIASFLVERGAERDDSPLFPAQWNCDLHRQATLRYGENPHQAAAIYAWKQSSGPSLVNAQKLNGKELSYNNLLDLDSALSMVSSIATPAVAVIKHNNPCGAATDDHLATATRRALDGDPVSAFGSVLGFNRPVDRDSAEVLVEPGRFIEAIVAPAFEEGAVELLTTRPKWKSNVRLLQVGHLSPGASTVNLRSIAGGVLAQESDAGASPESEWKVVTDCQPTETQWADLRFAWAMVRHVKSNAIVLSREQSLVGVGAGQMSRVDSVEIAIRKGGDRVTGAALGSDAFFPFADSIEIASKAGVSAVIQPGGSRRDDEVIAACNEHGIPLVLTGRRHFRH